MILCVPIQIHYKGQSNLRKKILSQTHTHKSLLWKGNQRHTDCSRARQYRGKLRQAEQQWSKLICSVTALPWNKKFLETPCRKWEYISLALKKKRISIWNKFESAITTTLTTSITKHSFACGRQEERRTGIGDDAIRLKCLFKILEKKRKKKSRILWRSTVTATPDYLPSSLVDFSSDGVSNSRIRRRWSSCETISFAERHREMQHERGDRTFDRSKKPRYHPRKFPNPTFILRFFFASLVPPITRTIHSPPIIRRYQTRHFHPCLSSITNPKNSSNCGSLVNPSLPIFHPYMMWKKQRKAPDLPLLKERYTTFTN
jgi:hypothetical protein